MSENSRPVYYKGIVRNGIKRDEHRIIMESFLGRNLNRHEVVHHINENKKDNRLENLQLMSLSEHSRMHMKNNVPSLEARANMSKSSSIVRKKKKISEKQVWEAMLLLNQNETQRSVALKYGISHQTLMRVVTLEVAKFLAVYKYITTKRVRA